MSITDLIPWKRTNKVAVNQEQEEQETRSLSTAQREMDRLFDDFFRGFGLAPYAADRWSSFTPRVDIVEDDREVRVSAELPGMHDDDIEVTVSRNALVISGEKREEKQEKGRGYRYAERSYGSFRRSVPLPAEVSQDKVNAVFEHGVLTVTLPKVKESRGHRRIPIRT